MNGNPGATAGATYVWGLQRGQGTARFGPIAPGVLFDSVVSITPGGVTSVRDLVTGAGVNLPASATVISGNKITVTFDPLLLPSQGLGTARYLINLWPRNGSANANISDFAPDNSDAALTLDFPVPLAATAQTELGVDTASFAFQRINRRLRDLRLQPAPDTRFSGFLTVDGRNGRHGLAGSTIGHSDNWTVTGGLDYRMLPALVVGATLRGGHTSASIAGDSHLDMDDFGGGLYAGWTSGPLYVNGFIEGSKLDFNSRRTIPIGALALTGRAEPKGDTLSGGFQAGWAFHNGDLAIIPLADLVLSRAKVGAYTETEPAGFGAQVDGHARQSTRLGLGAAIEQTMNPAWGTVFFHGGARWVQELGDRSETLTYAFNAQPERRLLLSGPKTSNDFWVLDVGMDAHVSRAATVGLSYTPRLDRDGLVDQQVSADFRMTF